MGRVATISEIETEQNNYKVEMWSGSGKSATSQYPKPAKLYKNTNDGWKVLEMWSAQYSKNQPPMKTPNQVLTEAIKKLRFYDGSPLGIITLDGQEFDARDKYIYFLQPSIRERNSSLELYRLGAKQVSEVFGPMDEESKIKDRVEDVTKSPSKTWKFTEKGNISEQF